MDFRRSSTVVVLGVVGVVIGVVGLVPLGGLVAAVAAAVVVAVALVGFWRERDHGLGDALRFKPAAIGTLEATVCGADKTAPWLLEKSAARDGKQLLRFVPRAQARTVDRKLARAVDREASVVVGLIGESKVGKTRCLFETVRQRLPDAMVFAPAANPDALAQVVGHRRFRASKKWSVLWLDDLEDFIDPKAAEGVDDELLDELLKLPRVVVAITAAAQWGLEHLDDAPSLARLIPGKGHDGQQLVSILGQSLADEIGSEGLGAACVAGPRLLDIHRSARHPSFESAQAVAEGPIVVECLIAAELLGLRSLTREQLRDVYRQTGTAHASEHNFDRGLRWATCSLYGEIALVLGHDDGYRVYSYVAEHAEPIGEYRQRAEDALAATIDIDEFLAIARRAHEAMKLQRALRLYELALERIDDAPRQAAVIDNIGIVQRELERFDDALGSLRRALAIRERMYGPEHPDVALALGNLGIVQSELGHFDDALASQERALAIDKRVYGPEHPHVATTLTNLGNVQLKLGHFEDALASLQRGLAIEEQLYGPDHPDVAATLTTIGVVQQELGCLKDALASQRRALGIKEKLYGPDHPEVATTLTNLGNVQYELEHPNDALASQQRALAIRERVHGPEHHEVATTVLNLGAAQYALGRLEDAQASVRRALAIFEAVYGPEHPDVALTLGGLGNMQRVLGRLDDALASLRRTLAIEERVYGPEHHQVASTLVDLGRLQLQRGQPEDAEACARRALAIFEAQLPDEHPQTRSARRLLSQLVRARGEVLLNIRDDDETAETDVDTNQ